MAELKLGQLKRVQAREVWKHEAHEFTPWLFTHIELLADALGVDIEVSASEAPVGTFAVDILGHTIPDGRAVIVENQLEATDHSHLGQLLTYAAGLDAALIVWLAPKFRDEHRQALNWLNAHTGDGVDFFGVELELLQVDDSAPAPHFKLAAQPNAWAKATREAVGVASSELGQRYQSLFQDVLNRFKSARPGATAVSRVGTGNWLGFAVGRSGFSYTWSVAAGGEPRVELYVDTGETVTSKAYFDLIRARTTELEAELGLQITWERLDDRRASRIAVYRPADGTSFDSESNREWLALTMVRWHDLMTPIVRSLPKLGDLETSSMGSSPT